MKLEPRRREGSRRRHRKRCGGGKGSSENTSFLYWFSNSHSFLLFFCDWPCRFTPEQCRIRVRPIFVFVFVGYGNIRVWRESYVCRTRVRVGTASETVTRRISAASVHQRVNVLIQCYLLNKHSTYKYLCINHFYNQRESVVKLFSYKM